METTYLRHSEHLPVFVVLVIIYEQPSNSVLAQLYCQPGSFQQERMLLTPLSLAAPPSPSFRVDLVKSPSKGPDDNVVQACLWGWAPRAPLKPLLLHTAWHLLERGAER